MLLHETALSPGWTCIRLAIDPKSSTVGTNTMTHPTGSLLFFHSRISLNTMTLQVESPTVYTSQGVPISVTGIAQVKIQGQNEDMLLVSFSSNPLKTLNKPCFLFHRLLANNFWANPSLRFNTLRLWLLKDINVQLWDRWLSKKFIKIARSFPSRSSRWLRRI